MASRATLVSAVSILILAVVAASAVALADEGSWNVGVLAVLLCLVVGGSLAHLESKAISISGDFLGIIVAMALLGPAQAVVLAVVGSIVWTLSAPTRREMALAGLAQASANALAGGLAMHAAADAFGVVPADPQFAVAVVVGFVVALSINVISALALTRILDGKPAGETFRAVVVPVLPSEAAMVLLASIIVIAEARLGVTSLAMLVALFFLYLYLLRELTVSQQRAHELEHRTEQLASLQVGVLTAMLRTLAMRDHMTARHSAAVARYTRAIAAAAGCTPEEQELAHTAGLLHDIGKFILPDHILLADVPLSDDDWQLIRMHPYQGAKVVREVEGYGPVADIIWCHHERMDGRGYPRGIDGEDIPLVSRMISIADTYDVMTSRDSYRDPVSSDEAIAELRRVSGSQVDGRLVDIFVQVLETEDLDFRHTDDADFERELAFERRVRDYAAPRDADLPAAA